MEFDDEATSRGLDLPRLFAAVAARKRWIVLPTLAAFGAALIFVAVTPARYTATAKVMLENGESYFTRPEKATPDGGAVIDDLAVESEAEAAKSPDVEREALAKLKPEDRAEFASRGIFSLFASGDDDGEAHMLESFGKQANIYSQAKTRVLLFEFTSRDRARAARGANALAQAFLESQQSAKDAETKSASKWLSDQIDALRVKVAAAESRVEALRAQSGLLPALNGLNVPSQQLSEIATQIATARAAEASATAKANALRDLVRAGRLDDIAPVANDESLRRYAETRVTLKAQIAELGRTLLPGHPRMKELEGQLAGLEQEIRAAAMKRVHGFEEEARIAGSQVDTLQKAVSTQAKTVTASDADQVKLREFEIDAKTAREQLESYLTKYREALARNVENAAPADGRIIAYARAPLAPSFPKLVPTLLLAPLAAMFVALGVVVSHALLSDGAPPRPVAKPAPAEGKREPALPFGIDPPLAAASAGPPATERSATSWSAAVESFVDRLAETSEGEGLPLMVAGEGDAGALPVALAAARRLTRHGATALVDLGPSPSWLADTFDREADDAPPRAGLSDLSAESADLAGVAHRDLSSALDIVPSGAGEIGPEALPAAMERLSRAYAFVVVHASDWRSPVARRAAQETAALLLAAPADAIAAVEARARAAFRGEGLAIKAVGVGPDGAEAARERAA